ncbi:MAG: hypothetical protein PHN26_08905 [Eubacteriaceae bacterium]|nr:hypothetical protein [Eubacteriaceae bacterium]
MDFSYKFVGYQILNFDTKEGNRIDGVNIFVLCKDENVNGYKAEKKFISRQSIDKMRINLEALINKSVNIFCDFKGRPVAIQELK